MRDSGGSARTPESERRELDRVGAFSDGVFAVAITLLVLNIEVPDVDGGDLGQALRDLLPSIQAYFIAFAVIGLFWYGHHKAWSQLERSSGRLVSTNLLLLSLIGLMPFTTALLGRFDEPLAVAVYSLNVGLASVADSLLDRVAISGRLTGPRDPLQQRQLLAMGWLRSAVFFVSIPLAWISLLAAQLFWLMLLVMPRLVRRWIR